MSKALLRSMLQVDPARRITIHELLTNEWVLKGSTQPIKWKSIYDVSPCLAKSIQLRLQRNMIDEEVAKEIAFYYGRSLPDTVALLKQVRLWMLQTLTESLCLF